MSIELRTLAPLLALAAAAPVAAQVAPGGNIDERVRQQVQPQSERDRTDALMTGDTDLLLLQKTRLFNIHGSIDLTTTSNAFLAPNGAVSDSFAQGQFGFGAATRIAGKVDVFADAGVVAVRYFDKRTLDYNALTGVVGVSMPVGPVVVGAAYQPSIVYTRDFKDRQLTSHRLRATVAAPFRVHGVAVEPSLFGERAISHPSDYSAWSAGASLTISKPLSKKTPLLVYASGGYDYRSFDHYFPDLLGVKRRDNGVDAQFGLIWRPTRWGELRARYQFGYNHSTSDVNGYTAHSGVVGLSGTLRF